MDKNELFATMPVPQALRRMIIPAAVSQIIVLGVGIPSATTSLLFDLDYMVVDKLMVAYSDAALAAIGIVLKVERLPLNTGIGICQGMVPLVAYNCASGDPRHRRRHHGAALAGRLPGWRPRARTETPQ